MTTTDDNGYRVEISRHIDLADLEHRWTALENRDTGLSFFHCWPWIATWLSEFQPDAVLVTAHHHQTLVTIGILGNCIQRRHYLVNSRQARLFQTGRPDEDQVWVEFNGFLCHPEHRQPATEACINALLSRQGSHDEVVLSMIRERDAEGLLNTFPHHHVSLKTPGYHVDLRSLAKTGQLYQPSLSRNTRYQVNRSIKKYRANYGDIQLTFAESAEQAIEFFDLAADFHIKRWHDSGYLNPKFTAFHHAFIKRGFALDYIDLIKITAGEHLVAIIYNVVYKDKVYFYLQGIQSETDGKMKPGLTAHVMLIEHYLDKGMKSYDFMGGHSQYKEQLADSVENYLIINVQKPLYRFRMENLLRRLKYKLL